MINILTFIFSIIFAVSIAGFLWPYAVYPLLIDFISRVKSKKIQFDQNFFPNVALLIPCYNEERVIGAKLNNSFQLNYDSGHLQIIVVDSGSTDKTRKIVSEYSDKSVKLLTQKERCGKASAINFALSQLDSEIVVVTDADAYLDQNAVKSLVGHFSDPEIGIVGGKVFTKSPLGSAETKGTPFLGFLKVIYLRKKVKLIPLQTLAASLWLFERILQM